MTDDRRSRQPEGEDPIPWHTGPAGDPGRYRIVSLAREATLLRAHRAGENDAAPVALKQLGLATAAPAPDVEVVQRLRAISHPNLVEFLEHFVGPAPFRSEAPPAADHLRYSATGWLDGTTVWATTATAGTLDVAALVQDAAAGLTALHHHGLVHNDVHPGNLMITADGCVVTDLDDVTHTGQRGGPHRSGVVGFVPPEADDGAAGTSASDGWQLAMVAVHALLGHPLGRDQNARDLSEPLQERLGRRTGTRVARRLSAMLTRRPEDRPTDLTAWASGLADDLRGTRRSRRSAAGAVAAVALAVAAFVGLRSEDAPTGEAATTGPVVAGDTSDGSSTSDDAAPGAACQFPEAVQRQLDALRPAVRDRVETAANGDCLESTDSFVRATYFVLDRGASREGGPNGDVIVVAPEGEVTRLLAIQWSSYTDMAGRERPENAADVGGYPIGVTGTDSEPRVELSSGGVLIARAPDEPPYWIPLQLLPAWEAAGGADGEFGYPMSHPFYFGGEIVQDFEFVELSTAPTAILQTADEIDLDVHRPQDPAAPLRAAGPVEGRILRQRGSQAWFVDDDGIRHWIPDGAVWNCLGGDELRVPSDIPGYAIHTLPEGPHARCDN